MAIILTLYYNGVGYYYQLQFAAILVTGNEIGSPLTILFIWV